MNCFDWLSLKTRFIIVSLALERNKFHPMIHWRQMWKVLDWSNLIYVGDEWYVEKKTTLVFNDILLSPEQQTWSVNYFFIFHFQFSLLLTDINWNIRPNVCVLVHRYVCEIFHGKLPHSESWNFFFFFVFSCCFACWL